MKACGSSRQLLVFRKLVSAARGRKHDNHTTRDSSCCSLFYVWTGFQVFVHWWQRPRIPWLQIAIAFFAAQVTT